MKPENLMCQHKPAHSNDNKSVRKPHSPNWKEEKAFLLNGIKKCVFCISCTDTDIIFLLNGHLVHFGRMGHSWNYMGNKKSRFWILALSFGLSEFHCPEWWSRSGVNDVQYQCFRRDETGNTQWLFPKFPARTHKQRNFSVLAVSNFYIIQEKGNF